MNSFVTPEQYLDYDRNAEVSNEYIFGEILPMEGVTANHGVIAANVVFSLKSRLSGSPCIVSAYGPRLSIDLKKGYFYPDISVVCGERQYLDPKRDTITNPKVVFEILSPSTQDRDLGIKARLYRKTPSLEALVFVEQETVGIEYWFRRPDGDWTYKTLESRDDILNIECINCEIPVAAIYDNVEFPPISNS